MTQTLRRVAMTLLLVGGLMAQIAPPGREEISARLVGEWTGQLRYRDFSSDESVVLPAWLTVTPSSDGRSLQFAYTYDDGPSKTVTESSTVTIDGRKYSVTSASAHSSDTYQIEQREPGSGSHGLEFLLTGAALENNKPVDVRITVTIDRNLYRYTKETASAGQDFKFRDEYVMTRRVPGTAKPDPSLRPK